MIATIRARLGVGASLRKGWGAEGLGVTLVISSVRQEAEIGPVPERLSQWIKGRNVKFASRVMWSSRNMGSWVEYRCSSMRNQAKTPAPRTPSLVPRLDLTMDG